jgi:dihydrofolate synthase/folylpolyglutamate synthase
MPVITVGGTNGKGSVCALLKTIFKAAGIRAGCYTSPHLLKFNERIQVDGEIAPDSALIAAFEAVEEARQYTGESLTYFEFTTLAAAWLFAQEQCDIVILEVGLGGRLDAVNIFTPTVAVVTSIGFDHMDYLGDNIESIAKEKAGIFRAHRPAIIGDAKAPAALMEEAKKTNAHIVLAGRDFCTEQTAGSWHYRGQRQLYDIPLPALRGSHQLANAAAVIAALERLPTAYWPGTSALRKGLHAVELLGRSQILPGSPPVILDVAHNEAAAVVLERLLFDMGYFPCTTAVLGMLARKDPATFVRPLLRRITHWYVAPVGDGNPHSIADAVSEAGGDVTVCDSIVAAAAQARAYCGTDGRMLVTGSFATVASYLQHVKPKN